MNPPHPSGDNMQNYIEEISREVNGTDYEITDFKIIENEKFSDDGHVIAKTTEIVVSLKSSKKKKRGALVLSGVTVVMGAVGYANDALGFISDILPFLTG